MSYFMRVRFLLLIVGFLGLVGAARAELDKADHLMDGMYNYYADASQFTTCKDGKTYPVATKADNATLERRYSTVKAGVNAKVWVRVKGRLIEQEAMEGSHRETALLVNEVIDMSRDKTCDIDGNPSLLGTRWHLIDVVGVEVPDSVDLAKAKLIFGGDGNVTGSTGCNSLNGSFQAEANSMTLGPLMTTRRACPEGLSKLESAVTRSLNEVDGYELSDGVLHLWKDGVPVLRYTTQ